MFSVAKLSINVTQHNNIESYYAECHHAEYLVSFIAELNVIMQSVVKLSVVMLIVIMLSVVAPKRTVARTLVQ
jgi:hypothetical protein